MQPWGCFNALATEHGEESRACSSSQVRSPAMPRQKPPAMAPHPSLRSTGNGEAVLTSLVGSSAAVLEIGRDS
jgi:hypothetical protein